MNKKSQFFGIFIAISAVIALGTALFILGTPKEIKGQLGVKQFDLLKDYKQGEDILFYIDQSAKLSSDLALSDFAFNGGFKIPKCGKVDDFSVWKKDCFPDFNQQYKIFFSQRLDSFIESYKSQASVPLNNYDLALLQRDKLVIVGVAKIPIFIDQKDDKDVLISRYSVYPHFSTEINYNTKEFADIVSYTDGLLDRCQTDTFNCVLKDVEQNHKDWVVEGGSTTSKVFKFSVPGKNVPVFDKDKKTMDYQPIKYRFALAFS